MRYRRTIALLLLSTLALPILAMPTGAVDARWSIEASPNFVFSGDSVNVTVTEAVEGSPYFSLNIRASNGTVMQELVSRTDDLGTAHLVVAFPLETDSGFYTFEVVEGGTIWANATVEVVKNDINWLHTLILEDREQLDQLRKAIVPLKREVAAHKATIADQWNYIIVTVVYAAAITLVCMFLFKPWTEFRALQRGGKVATKILHADMPMDFTHRHGITSNREMMEKELGEQGKDFIKDAPPEPQDAPSLSRKARKRAAKEARGQDEIPAPVSRPKRTRGLKRLVLGDPNGKSPFESWREKEMKSERRRNYGEPLITSKVEVIEEDIVPETLLDRRDPDPMPEPYPDPVIGEPMPRMTSAKEIAEEMRRARMPPAKLDIDAEDKISKMVRAMDARVRVGEVIPPQPKVEDESIPIQPPRNMNRKAPKAKPKVRNGRKGAGA